MDERGEQHVDGLNGATPTPGTIQAYITADMREKRSGEIQRIAVPRFNGRLIVRYGAVDPRTLIRIGISAEGQADPVDAVIDASVEALLQACEGTETEIDGEVHDLGKRLGAELAAYLGLTGAQNDREGVFLLFEDEIAIVNTANQLRQFQQLADQRIGEAIVGNSKAAA